MKRKIYLQLFADAADTGAESTDAKDTDTADTGAKDTETADKGGEKKYSDEDLDKIVGKKFAEWQKKQEKAVKEAEKLAKMDATQRAEHDLAEAKKELESYKNKEAIAEMMKTARKMLSDGGINVSDDVLAIIVSADADTTKKAIDGFKDAFTKAVEAEVKERLKGEPPRVSTGSGSTEKPKTKEEILSIMDHGLRQSEIVKHKEMFNFKEKKE